MFREKCLDKIKHEDIWKVNDKITSIKNRTALSDRDIEITSEYLMGKYNIDYLESLKKIINYAIDGKLKLERVRFGSENGISIMNVLTNLKEL